MERRRAWRSSLTGDLLEDATKLVQLAAPAPSNGRRPRGGRRAASGD
ncbi:MAG: hypothetical protein R3F59_32920 [Myxococcota bacterium]